MYIYDVISSTVGPTSGPWISNFFGSMIGPVLKTLAFNPLKKGLFESYIGRFKTGRAQTTPIKISFEKTSITYLNQLKMASHWAN